MLICRLIRSRFHSFNIFSPEISLEISFKDFSHQRNSFQSIIAKGNTTTRSIIFSSHPSFNNDKTHSRYNKIITHQLYFLFFFLLIMFLAFYYFKSSNLHQHHHLNNHHLMASHHTYQQVYGNVDRNSKDN